MTYQYDNRAYQPRDTPVTYQASKLKYGDNYLEWGGRASSIYAEDDSVFEADDAKSTRLHPQSQYPYSTGYRAGYGDSRTKTPAGLNPSPDRSVVIT